MKYNYSFCTLSADVNLGNGKSTKYEYGHSKHERELVDETSVIRLVNTHECGRTASVPSHEDFFLRLYLSSSSSSSSSRCFFFFFFFLPAIIKE